MNSQKASRLLARGLMQIQRTSFGHRKQDMRMFCRNQLRHFSKARPTFKSSISSTTTTTTTTSTTSKSPMASLRELYDRHKSILSSTGGRDDASLARYPNMKTPGGMLRGADYAGTLTFALTGTITAAQSGLDVFGSIVVGIITSVGGGTIRDAMFLNRKPFWTEETEYIWMGIVTGFLTFFLWPKAVMEWQQQKRLENKTEQESQHSQTTGSETATPMTMQSKHDYDTVDGILDTLDSIGLSAFAIIGAQNGIRASMPLLVSAICGMATATFGGVIRDVICGRPVRIVHSNAEVYAPPALAGATVYLAAITAGGSPAVRIGAAFAVCMGTRFWAVMNNVKLHTWDIGQDGVTIRNPNE